MTENITVTLAKPVEHNGAVYSSFTFREATAGDLATADAVSGNVNQTLAMLACMADVPIQAMKKIKARDLKRVMASVGGLMGEQDEDGGQTS